MSFYLFLGLEEIGLYFVFIGLMIGLFLDVKYRGMKINKVKRFIFKWCLMFFILIVVLNDSFFWF